MPDTKLQNVDCSGKGAETFRKWVLFGLSVLVILGSAFGAWYGALRATDKVNGRVDRVEFVVKSNKESTDKDIASLSNSLREKELILTEKLVTMKQEGTLVSQQGRRDIIEMKGVVNRTDATVQRIADKLGIVN